MKNVLVSLLAMFVGISVVGCKEEVFNEKETKVFRDAQTIKGIWVLSVDVKKDKLISSSEYIDKYLTGKNFVRIGKNYLKKVNPEEQVIDVCKVYIDTGMSIEDIDSNQISFYVLVRDGSNRLIHQYDPRVMGVVKEILLLIDDLEKGVIQ
jgi:hypothetical protein